MALVYVWAWIIMKISLAELIAITLVSTCILKETIFTQYKVKTETLKYIETKLTFITSKLTSNSALLLNNSLDYISVDQAMLNDE